MNTGSLCALFLAMGSGVLIAACSSDSANHSSNGTDAGSGGIAAAGGKASGGSLGASGGKANSGGNTASGGTGGRGGRGGTGLTDAEVGDGPESTLDGGGTSGTGNSGDGALSCAFPRCRPPYPAVPFSTANPYADDKATLGKILFWEEQMGQLDTMACGTCHRANSGGSDPRTNSAVAMLAGPDGIHQTQPDVLSDDLRVAQGVPKCTKNGTLEDGGTTPQTTARKPPTYLDAMFASQIFWDGRAGYCKNNEGPSGGCFYDPDAPATALIVGAADVKTGFIAGGALEQQASGPPANPTEMACDGQSWAAIEAKLAAITPLAKAKAGTIPTDMKTFIGGRDYPAMFQAVYGSDAKYKLHAGDPDNIINARRIVFAIATHERRLTSDQTPWDLWNDGTSEHAKAMTASQIAGFALFMGKARCSSCHPPPLFTDNAFHNIGFHKPEWDAGREAITGALNNADIGKFKTATLRNVGLREPFGLLHEGDGPGHSLDTILQLYNLGGKRTDSEILPLIDPVMSQPLGLTSGEVDQILDFLRNALTDPRVRTETFPFDRPKLGTE